MTIDREGQLAHPASIRAQKAASILRLAGNIGFWSQLVFGVFATVLLLLALAGLTRSANNPQGAGFRFSIFCATGGILALVFSIILFFRYKQVARLIQSSDPTDRPHKKTTLRTIKLGLIANLVGMLLAILGAESYIGILWGKLSTLPQGNTIYNASQLVQANDILLVLVNAHVILCHFLGIIIALWLLDRLNNS